MHALLITAVLLNALLYATTAAATPTVTTKNVTIAGLSLPQFKQHAFLGIPFAQPPLGDLRLRRPQPFNGTFRDFNATAYSPLCWNVPTNSTDSDGAGIPQNEDCLTLNVVRSDNVSKGSNLPVMVWIPGGGLFQGGSGIDWYNGSYLVQAGVNFSNPVVFVSFNYRLSQLGFLGGNALAEEGNLNLGHYDQRLALHWVQENIEAFGGDPKQVTIFGESSGAISVWLHFRAFGGRDDNLFRAGISESGSGDNYDLPNATAFQASYDQLIANSSCRVFNTSSDQLACLRRIPVDELRFAVQNWSTGAVVDGDIIPLSEGNSLDAYKKGLFVRRPMITGANSDEGASFQVHGVNTSEQVVAAFAGRPGISNATAEKLAKFYSPSPFLGCPYNTGAFRPATGFLDKQVCAIEGDIIFIALRRYAAQQMAAHNVSIRSYRFNQRAQNFTDEQGVGHFSEVQYVFGNPTCPMQLGRCLSLRAEDLALSSLMQSMWLAFVVHLDPNKNNFPGAPQWPDYADEAENMVFQNGGPYLEKDDFRQEGIQFLIDEYFPNVGAK